PEAPEIVRAHYTPADLATLKVRPGVTSPGTVYYYTHGESTLGADGTVEQYAKNLLPVKLPFDRASIDRPHGLYDIRRLRGAVGGTRGRAGGKAQLPERPELSETECGSCSHAWLSGPAARRSSADAGALDRQRMGDKPREPPRA